LVLAVPKQLLYFMHRGPALQSTALRLFVRAVEQCLRACSAATGPAARFRLVVFIHRFGSALVPHLHFHCGVLDGVVESAPAREVFSEAGGKILS
jgi:diadenosine tetraphosphate (Ap4A) HIT family hydrolase